MKRLLVLFILGALVTPGCQRKPAPADTAEPPVVTVCHPGAWPVTDYVDFTGNTAAPFSVDIRPRVTGYLVAMPFKEGDHVKENQVLFEIDNRPYKASLDKAKGDVKRQQAALEKSQADLDIALNVRKENPAAMSKQEVVKRTGTRDEAIGSLEVAKATEESSQLNFNWCKVTSPISGRVSRYFFTLGNLVNQDTTLLTTVVSEDPMYAYFDIDERTLEKIRKAINAGTLKIPTVDSKEIPVLLGLQTEKGFPHEGYLDFINNKVESSTGTLTVRGVFKNPLPKNGVRMLVPGMFVRIRLPIGSPRPTLLVPDRAIGSNQGIKFVYVVNKDNEVESRKVITGPLQKGGLRVIEGTVKPDPELKADDWVIVNGLQFAQPHRKVTTEEGEKLQPPEEEAKKVRKPAQDKSK